MDTMTNLQCELLAIAIKHYVQERFDLDARIERARKAKRPVKHLTHYRRLVKTLELQRAA